MLPFKVPLKADNMHKITRNSGMPVLGQLLSFIPRSNFNRLVGQLGTDRGCWWNTGAMLRFGRTQPKSKTFGDGLPAPQKHFKRCQYAQELSAVRENLFKHIQATLPFFLGQQYT